MQGAKRVWIEKLRALGMTGDYGDFIGVVECQMGVDEDKEVGDGLGQRERVGKEGPGVGVRIENNCQEGRWRFLLMSLLA